MDRRTFICIVASGALASPHIGGAQQARRVWRIGFIASGNRPADGDAPAPLREQLQALGFAEGNVTYEGRWGQGRNERLRELAADLFSHKLDVVVAFGGPAADPRNKRPRARRSSSLVPVTSWKRVSSRVSHVLTVT